MIGISQYSRGAHDAFLTAIKAYDGGPRSPLLEAGLVVQDGRAKEDESTHAEYKESEVEARLPNLDTWDDKFKSLNNPW